MKRIFLFCICFSIISFIFASEPLKIAVISDVHFLASSIAKPSPALDKYEVATGRHLPDLHAALDKALYEIEAAKTDVLLVSGDMTNHGEKESYLGFIEKLKPLRERGMRVFVVPGNHDINVPDAKAFMGDKPAATQSISAEEFTTLYASFGYADAIKKDTASLSYLAALNDSLWLLCFDTNRYAEYKTSSISGGRILPQTLTWSLEVLREAKEKNITVFGMMHHGLVEHMPYQSAFFSSYLIDEWKHNAEILADAGLKVVFTGHFHANDVTLLTTSAGNPIYDVETGSLSQYPFPYRLMAFDGRSLAIDTHFIESIPKTPDLQEKYRLKMQTFARKTINARIRRMGFPIPHDTREALLELLVQMSILHAHGDEQLDEATRKTIREVATVFDNEELDIESFQLDFPPADNRLTINLREK